MLHNFQNTGLIILLVIFAVEVILSASWNVFYFSIGIPIFIKKFEIKDTEKVSKRVQEFINTLDKKSDFSKLTGIKISEYLFLFRRKMIVLSKSNSECLTGSISIDSENRCVVIKGYLNYSIIALLLFISLIIGTDVLTNIKEGILFIFISIAIVTVIIALYRYKYNKIADEVKYIINRWY